MSNGGENTVAAVLIVCLITFFYVHFNWTEFTKKAWTRASRRGSYCSSSKNGPNRQPGAERGYINCFSPIERDLKKWKAHTEMGTIRLEVVVLTHSEWDHDCSVGLLVYWSQLLLLPRLQPSAAELSWNTPQLPPWSSLLLFSSFCSHTFVLSNVGLGLSGWQRYLIFYLYSSF